jgi:outer membrane lipoprotein-sorting protein
MKEEDTMKKTLTICLLGLFLASLSVAVGYGQTTKEILDKMIDAQGGRKVLAAIKDTTITATMELAQQGMSGNLTIYQKEPDKMRMDIEIQGMIITQAFDGDKGWQINPMAGGIAAEMTESETRNFKKQALGNDSFLNPEKFGITYAFKGKEKIQDKEYLVLEQSYADGQKVTMYIDPVTYLTYKANAKVDQMGTEIDQETFFGDYRKEGNTVAAHSMTVFQSGAEAIRMTFNKITFNTGIQDSLFKMSK